MRRVSCNAPGKSLPFGKYKVTCCKLLLSPHHFHANPPSFALPFRANKAVLLRWMWIQNTAVGILVETRASCPLTRLETFPEETGWVHSLVATFKKRGGQQTVHFLVHCAFLTDGMDSHGIRGTQNPLQNGLSELSDSITPFGSLRTADLLHLQSSTCGNPVSPRLRNLIRPRLKGTTT